MVKKIASIFFLSALLFNWFGYRILSSYMEEKANSRMMAILDNDQYSDADLVTIKLPSHLPYYTNSSHFSRIDGEIEMNGVHYNYVKCRMYKDSAEYLCIPNKTSTNLSEASNEFFKLVNDFQHQNKKSGNAAGAKSPLSEYYQDASSWTFSAYTSSKSMTTSFYFLFFPASVLSPRENPPDAC